MTDTHTHSSYVAALEAGSDRDISWRSTTGHPLASLLTIRGTRPFCSLTQVIISGSISLAGVTEAEVSRLPRLQNVTILHTHNKK